MTPDVRRGIPAIHTLLADAAFAPLLAQAPRGLLTALTRTVVERVRATGDALPGSVAEWAEMVRADLRIAMQPSARRVINATGVVLHTNLGRAPLATAALDAIRGLASGYSNLEFDLATGDRGSRLVLARALLCELTGAEDALVVNNGAAALVLALRAHAADRDVLVSRGELVEIGGSFRIPDIMRQAGVRLVEIGTTNRTHLDDYRRALTDRVGAIVKVHHSNFAMSGFVAEVSARELAPVAAEADVPLILDFGSGLLLDLAPWGLTGEPTAREALQGGANLVLMSGDKLLGGPQAGIALGTRTAVDALRRHPLARALRVDKLTLAALEATLQLYRDPQRAVRDIPVLAMLTTSSDALRARAEALSAAVRARGVNATVSAASGAVGGGAFPTASLSSWALALPGDAARWEVALRAADVPVVGRVANGVFLADVRTVLLDDEEPLVTGIAAAAP